VEVLASSEVRYREAGQVLTVIKASKPLELAQFIEQRLSLGPPWGWKKRGPTEGQLASRDRPSCQFRIYQECFLPRASDCSRLWRAFNL